MTDALAEKLVGSWLLLRWSVSYPDGRPPVMPFGADALGLLIYGADGWMSATMCRNGRVPLSATSAFAADDASKARAFEGYLAYAGRWTVEGDVIRHEVRMSLNPVLIGVPQFRRARLDVDRLDLSADEQDGQGRSRSHSILWRRAQ
jgi:hypothetical protein